MGGGYVDFGTYGHWEKGDARGGGKEEICVTCSFLKKQRDKKIKSKADRMRTWWGPLLCSAGSHVVAGCTIHLSLGSIIYLISIV